MVKTIQVIVSKCIQDRIYGDRLVDLPFESLDTAFLLANHNREKGKSVLVRPNYNEVDAEGNRYFREWRSFNGEELKEVRFSF